MDLPANKYFHFDLFVHSRTASLAPHRHNFYPILSIYLALFDCRDLGSLFGFISHVLSVVLKLGGLVISLSSLFTLQTINHEFSIWNLRHVWLGHW